MDLNKVKEKLNEGFKEVKEITNKALEITKEKIKSLKDKNNDEKLSLKDLAFLSNASELLILGITTKEGAPVKLICHKDFKIMGKSLLVRINDQKLPLLKEGTILKDEVDSYEIKKLIYDNIETLSLDYKHKRRIDVSNYEEEVTENIDIKVYRILIKKI